MNHGNERVILVSHATFCSGSIPRVLRKQQERTLGSDLDKIDSDLHPAAVIEMARAGRFNYLRTFLFEVVIVRLEMPGNATRLRAVILLEIHK